MKYLQKIKHLGFFFLLLLLLQLQFSCHHASHCKPCSLLRGKSQEKNWKNNGEKYSSIDLTWQLIILMNVSLCTGSTGLRFIKISILHPYLVGSGSGILWCKSNYWVAQFYRLHIFEAPCTLQESLDILLFSM